MSSIYIKMLNILQQFMVGYIILNIYVHLSMTKHLTMSYA